MYLTPAALDKWAADRDTAEEIAEAIHAEATSFRSPQAIWENPTLSEMEAVLVLAWAAADPEETGLYWGLELHHRPEPTTDTEEPTP